MLQIKRLEGDLLSYHTGTHGRQIKVRSGYWEQRFIYQRVRLCNWVYKTLPGQGLLVTCRHGLASQMSLGCDIPAISRLAHSSRRDWWAPQDSTMWASRGSWAPEQRQVLPPFDSLTYTTCGPPLVSNQLLLLPTSALLAHPSLPLATTHDNISVPQLAWLLYCLILHVSFH